MSGLLQDRVAIITGANQGLGLEIALHYARAGARLVMCARDIDLLTLARERVAAACAHPDMALAVQADIGVASDCEQVLARTLSAFARVDILVNNAGIYGPKGPIEDIDWQAWVDTVTVNLLGSVKMSQLVVRPMRQSGYGKIIQLSGGGATNPLPNISAYAATKAAIVRFAETLAEELRGSGVDVNCIAPGALNTRMLDEVLQAGPDAVGEAFYQRSLKQKEQGGAGLVKGAELAVYLASAASDGLTGKLLSAIWDPWADLADHAADLNGTDVYTLRRIVPKDRGLDWGH